MLGINMSKELVGLNKLLVAAELEHDLKVYHWKLENCSKYYKDTVTSTVFVFRPDKKIDYSGGSYNSVINDSSYFPVSLVASYESDCIGYNAYILPASLESIHAM